MSDSLHIAMIGTNFMGKAHSNAWRSVGTFFDLPREIAMHTVVSRDAARADAMQQRWGWRHGATDIKQVVTDDSVDLVDLCTPNHLHAEHALLALKHHKHVACEKPLAGTLDDARQMRDAARRARRRGIHTFVWFNYRRCPAIALAYQLIRRGDIGRIHHIRAMYLQDWGGPDTPMSWRFNRKLAGSGAHGDLNAHIIDLARFLTGDSITTIHGAVSQTFITKRRDEATGKDKRSTVDDAFAFLATFKSGATASFEASRIATGNQNRNTIEINGSDGSIRFDFERMNELEYFDGREPAKVQGWRRIMCTTPGEHPYIHAYWPPAHPIGYEHGFISQAADIITVLSGGEPELPLPDFDDAYETQRVLEAAMIAADEQRMVKMTEVK